MSHGLSAQANEAWRGFLNRLNIFTSTFEAAASPRNHTHGQINQEVAQRVPASLANVLTYLDAILGPDSQLKADDKEVIGAAARQALLPTLLLSPTAHRMICRPRSLVIDYVVMNAIADNQASGNSQLATLIDTVILSLPFFAILRERMRLMRDQILLLEDVSPDPILYLTSLGSAAAPELCLAYRWFHDGNHVIATLIDHDAQALAYYADSIAADELAPHVTRLVYADPRHLIDTTIATYLRRVSHLAYSIRLVDDLPAHKLSRLLTWVYDHLRDGGRAIFSFSAPQTPGLSVVAALFGLAVNSHTAEEIEVLVRQSPFALAEVHGDERLSYIDLHR